MLKLLTRLAREINWARRRWSASRDQEFHEDLYRSDDYDPFSLAYPGYVTIRRFADLVEPVLPASGVVVDFGCGPGEITCELAARRADLTFLGIDHSSAAIAKANKNTSRCRVRNVRFHRSSVDDYVPDGSIDLATLFDSFHHLTQPSAFVRRLGPHVRRWALVEPRGSTLGRWQKDVDFDWVAHDLDKIRARIASIAPLAPLAPPAPSAPPAPPAPPASPAAAVERRYTLDDLQRLFEGYSLDLRGTVAGLESYPPGANQDGELKRRFGALQYQAYREIDEWLFSQNLDLHAKHWLIVAERGGKSRTVDMAAIAGVQSAAATVAGPYDVTYGGYRGPHEARAGERLFGFVQLKNEGSLRWSSDADRPVLTSYHWLDASGRIVAFDGERTRLPSVINPNESCEVTVAIVAPQAAGSYRLAVDLVCEGVTWFSQAGRPWLEIPFTVKPG